MYLNLQLKKLGKKGEADYTLGSLSMKWENLTYRRRALAWVLGEAQSSLQADTRHREITFHMKGSVDRGHTENVPGEERADGHCCLDQQPRPEADSFLGLWVHSWPILAQNRGKALAWVKHSLIVETMEAETGSSPGGKHGLSRRKCSKKPLCQSPLDPQRVPPL